MLELNSHPNMGDLMGGSQSSALLSAYINETENRSQYFGSNFDRLQEFRQQFVDQLVTPVRQAGVKVMNFMKQIISDEVQIKPLTTMEDLKHVPPELYLPILTYAPVYDLHKQGRIDGFGIEPHHVKMVKPIYDRLIDENGYVDLTYPSKFGTKFIYHEYHSTDPEMTVDMLDAIWDSREFIQEILDETELDPTDIDNLRG
jgi:hypothetical protein